MTAPVGVRATTTGVQVWAKPEFQPLSTGVARDQFRNFELKAKRHFAGTKSEAWLAEP